MEDAKIVGGPIRVVKVNVNEREVLVTIFIGDYKFNEGVVEKDKIHELVSELIGVSEEDGVYFETFSIPKDVYDIKFLGTMPDRYFDLFKDRR